MRLKAGDRVLIGTQMITVDTEFASGIEDGDRVIGIASTGELLRLPSSEVNLVANVVSAASQAFVELRDCGDEAISGFYDRFAKLLADPSVVSEITLANHLDVSAAKSNSRSTTRLEFTETMRHDMIDALLLWRDFPSGRGAVTNSVVHDGWTVETLTAPLGVVGFVFEGRPNVFADATGVLRGGNTCVFRIGSDALRTAKAIMQNAIEPALEGCGLPIGSICLVESRSHSAGWALFSDTRIALAVARGSGKAVSQLGAIARQAGIAVSLHGTGGAWMIAGEHCEASSFRSIVENSLDRKVCNTLNVLCVLRSRQIDLLPLFKDAITAAARSRGTEPIVHLVNVDAQHFLEGIADLRNLEVESLGTEWEWENSPECSVVVVENLSEAVALFNKYSPNFIISVATEDEQEADYVWRQAEAPFVSNGMTRWVDGQFALLRPELGLSNWQAGRLLGRGAILSGDSVHSVRYRVNQSDKNLRR